LKIEHNDFVKWKYTATA